MKGFDFVRNLAGQKLKMDEDYRLALCYHRQWEQGHSNLHRSRTLPVQDDHDDHDDHHNYE